MAELADVGRNQLRKLPPDEFRNESHTLQPVWRQEMGLELEIFHPILGRGVSKGWERNRRDRRLSKVVTVISP